MSLIVDNLGFLIRLCIRSHFWKTSLGTPNSTTCPLALHFPHSLIVLSSIEYVSSTTDPDRVCLSSTVRQEVIAGLLRSMPVRMQPSSRCCCLPRWTSCYYRNQNVKPIRSWSFFYYRTERELHQCHPRPQVWQLLESRSPSVTRRPGALPQILRPPPVWRCCTTLVLNVLEVWFVVRAPERTRVRRMPATVLLVDY